MSVIVREDDECGYGIVSWSRDLLGACDVFWSCEECCVANDFVAVLGEVRESAARESGEFGVYSDFDAVFVCADA